MKYVFAWDDTGGQVAWARRAGTKAFRGKSSSSLQLLKNRSDSSNISIKLDVTVDRYQGVDYPP